MGNEIWHLTDDFEKEIRRIPHEEEDFDTDDDW
jgi:hypothetical protein